MFKTGLEIAQEYKMEHIRDIAARIGVGEEGLEYYGNYKAEVSLDLLHRNEGKEDSKLILVTAIDPIKAGEGKSITTVGLGDVLDRLGGETMITLRESGLGPVFGLEGGATGGGYAQVVPTKNISLHFIGDIYVITAVNNLISVYLDNHTHQGNKLDIDIENITWEHYLDINGRTLRHITIGQGPKANGVERMDGSNITVASEVMTVLCLSTSLMNLKERLGNMLMAFNLRKEPTYIRDPDIGGVLTMVMKDAIKPNMVQTLEHNPVLIHGDPSANVARGCNSILAVRTRLELVNYTATEASFGVGLGTGKFLDIKCRFGGLKPSAVVIVVTVRVLKQYGNIAYEDLKDESVETILTGCENLAKHIDTVRQLGLPYIVVTNELASDTPAEAEVLQNRCGEHQHPINLPQVQAKDEEGALDLVNQLVKPCAEENNYAPLYDVEQNIEGKITTTVIRVYGVEGVAFMEEVKKQIVLRTSLDWDKMPICMAKTQMSPFDGAKVYRAPKNFTITARELHPSLGAGFLVALTGRTLTTPGLPKMPVVNNVDVDKKGHIEGLL